MVINKIVAGPLIRQKSHALSFPNSQVGTKVTNALCLKQSLRSCVDPLFVLFEQNVIQQQSLKNSFDEKFLDSYSRFARNIAIDQALQSDLSRFNKICKWNNYFQNRAISQVKASNYGLFENLFTFNNIENFQTKLIRPFLDKRAVILQAEYDWNGAFQPADRQCRQLADGLSFGGFNAEIVTFVSRKDLFQKLSKLDGEVSLLWLRIHGAKDHVYIGPNHSDVAHLEDFVSLSPKLTKNPYIVFQSCETGKVNGLADKVGLSLQKIGVHSKIIAPSGSPVFVAIDMLELTNNCLRVPMCDFQGIDLSQYLSFDPSCGL